MPNPPVPTPPPALPKQPPAVKNPAPATVAPTNRGPVSGATRSLNNAQPLPQPVIPSMAKMAQPVPPPPRPAATPGQVAPQSAAPGLPPSQPPRAPIAAAGVAAAPAAAGVAAARPGQPLAQAPRPAGAGNLPPAPPASPAKPVAAPPPPPTKSPFRFLPFILLGLLVLIGGIFLASRFLGGSKPSTNTATNSATPRQQTTITYWGLWEPSDVMTEVISEYEQANPGVKVEYQQQSYKDYRERLQTAVASGKGPDIFRFHASWVPMLSQELSPVPATVYSPTEFQQKFYQVANDQLTLSGNLVGVPLMYDGLALYYNTDILRTANVSPPTTWAELRTLAKQLTIRSSSRKLERAGVALGNATNVEHFSDIIGLLILQNGGSLSQPNGTAAQEAIKFYSDFYSVDKDWDESLPSSTVAFARGEAAMMIAPSWRAHEVKAQNPNLNFGIAPVPQLSDRKVGWASYWAEGVSQTSKNKAEAWKFIKYMSDPATLRKFNSSASQARPFGEIYPQREMAGDVASDPYVAAYLIDAPYAQGGFMSSFTHDNGLNDQVIQYYKDAVTAMNQGKQAAEAMVVVQQGVDQVLRQYGLATQNPVTLPEGQITQ